MNVAVLTLGTRGDVQPYVALSTGLKQAGHEVTLVTGKGFDELVAGRGLRYVALDLDLLELARSPEGKAALRSARGALRLIRQLLHTWRQMLVDEWEAAWDADAVVYHPKAFGGYHIAEALDVPGFLALPVPALSPTRAFPTPVLPLPNLGGALNRLSYELFFHSSTAPYRRMINWWREHTLGLAPLSLLASELKRDGEPVTKLYCCSQHVVPVPADWDKSSLLTGYWFLNQGSGWEPSNELATFLEDGSPPVYIGFGSTAPDSEGSRAAALAALKGLGRRGVLATGRSGMAGPQVIEIDSAPHDWLFPRMSAVVHHGGAGTTAEGLRAGRPTAVFPSNFGDQLYWGMRAHTLGLGPKPVPQKKLTTERLAAAIRAVTENKRMRSLAEELGERIRAENGVARAVEIIGEVRRMS